MQEILEKYMKILIAILLSLLTAYFLKEYTTVSDFYKGYIVASVLLIIFYSK